MNIQSFVNLPNTSECDCATFNDCDPYVKLFIDRATVLRTPVKVDTHCTNFDTTFVSKKILRSTRILLEVWDDDSGFLGSNDDLLIRAGGNIDSFLQRGIWSQVMNCGITFIEAKSFWQDELE